MKQLVLIFSCIAFLSVLQAQNLYGTASGGDNGVNGQGAICKLVPGTGTLTAAYTFDDPNPDGRSPLYTDLVQAANGKLYGMTYGGGSNNYGTIFSFDPATSAYAKLKDFIGTNGAYPNGSLIQANDGKLYGMTTGGGNKNAGTIFSFDPASATFTKLIDFDSTNGYYPYGSLMQASDGKLYGMAANGGSNDFGVIFSYNIATATFAKLKDFDSTNGSYPNGSFIQATNGKLYATTTAGGSSDAGVIFSFTPSSSTYAKLVDFNSRIGSVPYGNLMQATDGKLYGMTYQGGNYKLGVIFSYNITTSAYTRLFNFDDTNGANPYSGLTQTSDGKLYGMTNFGGTNNRGVIFSINPATSAYAKLLDFNGYNGSNPHDNLTLASDGKFYAMTRNGGGTDDGVIFSFNPANLAYNRLKVLGTVPNGANIQGGLVKNAAGKLFGMFSDGGGTNGYGGIFSFDPATSAYAKLQDFDLYNGAYPRGGLTLATNGKLYGMTTYGGTSGFGIIFSFDPATSSYTKLKDFDSINGANPYGNLIQATNGKLYGMTLFGGNGNYGVIFSFDPANGTYTKLKDFDGVNGANPRGAFTQTADGKLYGMTRSGGNSNIGVIFSFNPTTSVYTKLADFTGGNGAFPYGNLTLATNGKMYGMAYSGGSSGVGVLFSFNPATSTFTKLKDFNLVDGSNPRGSLTQASNGKLYGMTTYGGAHDYGTAFSFDTATAVFTKIQDFDGSNGIYPQYTYFTEITTSQPSVKINNVSVQEGNSGSKNVNFTVTLSKTSSQTIQVDYVTKNSTAIAPGDYTATSGTLTFAPGVKTQTIAVSINGDTQVENNETFKVLLSNPVNATISDNTGVCTIQNDDAAVVRNIIANSSMAMVVSPNPAASNIRVQLTGFAGNIKLQLINLQGKVLKEAALQTGNSTTALQQFDIADLASGTYLMIVLDEKGNKQMQKVVVSH